MAYSNTWTVIAPAGSDAASTADDELRKLRLDLQERMNDIVGDWTVDPVKLLRGVPLHWSLGNRDRSTGADLYDGSSGGRFLDPAVIGGGVIWHMPILVQPGITIGQIDFRVYRDTAAAVVTCSFKSIDASATESDIKTVSSTSTGWHTVSLTSLATTVVVTSVYMVRVVLTSDAVGADTARLLWVTIDP